MIHSKGFYKDMIKKVEVPDIDFEVPEKKLNLNPRQKKTFKEWFETGVESYDEQQKKVYCYRDNFLVDPSLGAPGRTEYFNPHLGNTLIIPSERPMYEMLFLLTSKRTEDLGESALETLSLYLYKYAIGEDEIEHFIAEFYPANKGLKEFVKSCFDVLVKDVMEAGKTCDLKGFSPREFYYVKYVECILDYSFRDSNVSKKLKKLCEKRMSELLHTSFKSIGLKSLSRTMETVFAVIDEDIKLTNVDKGICSLIYILMTIDYANTVACHSVFPAYILSEAMNKGIVFEELEKKRLETLEQSEQYNFEDAIQYFYENTDLLLDEVSKDDLLTSYVIDGNADRKLRFYDVKTTFTKNLDKLKNEAISSYSFETWNAKNRKEQALVLIKYVIGLHLQNEIYETIEWFPFIELKENKNTSECSPKKKRKEEKSLEKLSAENAKNLKEIKDLKEKYSQTVSEFNALKKDSKQLQKQNHELKQEINKMKSERETLKLSDSEREELYRLREFAFSMSLEEELKIDSDEIEEDVIRNAGNIVLVGGHTTLYRKLLDKYENIRVIDGRKRFPYDMIHSANYVFFLFSFMKHSSYYQGCFECSKVDVPYGYIAGTNLQKAERQMIHQIKETLHHEH